MVVFVYCIMISTAYEVGNSDPSLFIRQCMIYPFYLECFGI